MLEHLRLFLTRLWRALFRVTACPAVIPLLVQTIAYVDIMFSAQGHPEAHFLLTCMDSLDQPDVQGSADANAFYRDSRDPITTPRFYFVRAQLPAIGCPSLETGHYCR